MRVTETFYSDLANRIRDMRAISGYTQEELARLLEINESTYRSYETGYRRPQVDTIVSLSAIYKVSVDYLLGNQVQADIPDYIGIVKDGFTDEQIEKIKKYAELVRQNML